jgi:hypothetical protein
VVFHDVTNMTAIRYGADSPWYSSQSINGYGSFVCWSALRTGKAHFPESLRVLESTRDVYGTQNYDDVGRTWDTIQVHYDANCTDYLKTATDVALLEHSYFYNSNMSSTLIYGDGDCIMGSSAYCTIHDEKPGMCRLNVRMSAAFILAACLVLKATYMLSVNLLARGKPKSQCLTFGDVIVASASDPDLRVQGECMVNGGDNYRRHNTHTCHKHCRGVEDSKTGDELGHCQKCKRWNSTNMFSNEPQPTIATKFKRSLISNLGNTALTQMCLLMLCTLALVGASIAIAVPLGMANENQKENCDMWFSNSETKPLYCSLSDTARFEQLSGGWGGFNRSLTAAALEPDRLSNEVLSFAISNGAQFIYSLLYLMMIYNITLISQEHTWGKLEYGRKRLRTTLVAGESFAQDYLLQLPKKILFPTMVYSVLTHWMLGEALQTQEAIWLENADGRHVEHSRYNVCLRIEHLTTGLTVLDHVCCVSGVDSNIPQPGHDRRVLVGLHVQTRRLHSTDVRQHQGALRRDDAARRLPFERDSMGRSGRRQDLSSCWACG